MKKTYTENRANVLESNLYEYSMTRGEILDPEHTAQVVLEWEMDNAPLDRADILAAVWNAAESFVDSMVENEHDTETEGRDDLEPLEKRVERWEAMRPSHSAARTVKTLIASTLARRNWTGYTLQELLDMGRITPSATTAAEWIKAACGPAHLDEIKQYFEAAKTLFQNLKP